MSKLNNAYSLALLLGLCAATLAYCMPVFPYSPDSACYIEQAKTFMERGVFESGLYSTFNPTVSYVPDPLFPPAYPLLIALFSWLLPVPPEIVALFLSLVALSLIPACTVYAFKNLVGSKTALFIGLLLVTTPIIVRWGNLASTDILSLLLIIFCLGLVFKADESVKRWCVIGLLVGFAYLLRNANLAFILSVSGLIAWRILFESQSRRHQILCAGVWLVSFAVVVVPWMIRNYWVFGKIQPYSMPPSNVGVIENTHAFIQAQLNVLLPLAELNEFLARNSLGLFVLIGLFALLCWQVIKTWKMWPKIEQHALLISTLYCLLGAAIVIAARTKYQWGELIGERHSLPYLFALLLALTLIFKNTTLRFNKHWLSLVLLAGLLLPRFYALPRLYEYKINSYHANVLAAAAQIKTHRQTDPLCTNLNGRFGVSNYAFVYRVLCGVPARHIFPILHGDEFHDKPITELLDLPIKQGIVVSIFPNHDMDKKDLPLKQAFVDRLSASGWHVEKNEVTGFVLTR